MTTLCLAAPVAEPKENSPLVRSLARESSGDKDAGRWTLSLPR